MKERQELKNLHITLTLVAIWSFGYTSVANRTTYKIADVNNYIVRK